MKCFLFLSICGYHLSPIVSSGATKTIVGLLIGLVFFSFWTQFALIGGELWFLVLTMDLHFATTNPFTSYKLNAKRYEVFVLMGSIGTASILIAAGPKVYGLSSDATCWIQDNDGSDSQDDDDKTAVKYNVAKSFLFYIWMAIIYSYCLYVVLFVFRRLKQGLSETLTARLSTVRRAQSYVLGYTFFWLFPLVFSFIDFVLQSKMHHTLRTLTALCLSIRGLFSIVILLSPNWTEMKAFLDAKTVNVADGLVQNVVEEDLSLRPHLNSVLRAEIIFFTTQGIRFASREGHNGIRPTGIRIQSDKQRGISSHPTEPNDTGDGESSNDAYRCTGSSDGQLDSKSDVSRPVGIVDTSLTGDISRSENVKTFMCNDITRSSVVGSVAQHSNSLPFTDSITTLNQVHDMQRESISVNDLADELDEALDTLGVDDSQFENCWDSGSKSIGCRSNDDRSTRDGQRDDDLQDVENPVWEDSYSKGERFSSGTETTSRQSAASTDLGRLSENEFRLVIDKSLNVKAGDWKHMGDVEKTTPPQVHGTNSTLPVGGQSETNSARDRIKRNLLTAATHAKGAFVHSVNVPNDFIFKDYLPHLFAQVRQTCGIDPVAYEESFKKTTKEKFSEGRSGAFLYFSSDQKYIVKTTTKGENQALLDIMKDYVSYLIANPNSLIVRFLGAHSLTLYNRVLYFVVMLNVFSKAELSERYDLKGSWVNRHGEDSQRRRKLKYKSVPLYKDNDLQHKITLHPDVANALHDQILRDSAFLSGLGLMDYSLLVGVVRRKFEVMERFNPGPGSGDSTDAFQRDSDGGMHAAVVEGPGTYYMGIIDVLQHWNWQKKLERFFKIYFKWEDGDGLSAIQPNLYGDRFMRRCVVEVFDGLHVRDSDFNPKMKSSTPYLYNLEGIEGSPSMKNADIGHSGIDRRFSAAPISSSYSGVVPSSAESRSISSLHTVRSNNDDEL
mmetsp:Transcript_24984/g.36876  ORF Transcript_24984/g.36876 Transcript_24984/m.36876 type:complete len:952 (-) Transcript_24984:91-2946(-)